MNKIDRKRQIRMFKTQIKYHRVFSEVLFPIIKWLIFFPYTLFIIMRAVIFGVSVMFRDIKIYTRIYLERTPYSLSSLEEFLKMAEHLLKEETKN